MVIVKKSTTPNTTTTTTTTNKDSDRNFLKQSTSRGGVGGGGGGGDDDRTQDTTVYDKERNKNSINRHSNNVDDLVVLVWIGTISCYIVLSILYPHLGPKMISNIFQPNTLTLIHHISNMIFSGGIITASILEWIVIDTYCINKLEIHVVHFWFVQVPAIEQWIVLPSLMISIVSGICKSFVRYGTFKDSPNHIQYTLLLLTIFGVWWGITDKTTQGPARDVVQKITIPTTKTTTPAASASTVSTTVETLEHAHEIPINKELTTTPTPTPTPTKTNPIHIPLVFQLRKISNTISCIFILALYGVMTLKPGYNNNNTQTIHEHEL